MSIEYDINSAFLYIKRIIDEYKNKIEAYQYRHCIYITEQFYNWYCHGLLSADDLYTLIDCKDNLEVDSIFNFAEFYEMGMCEEIHYMWEIILTIFTVIVWIAYQKENRKHIPQDMEAITPVKISDFFNQIEMGMAPKELFEYFSKEVCY